MRTLLELVQGIENSGSEAIRFHTGYRTWVHPWSELRNQIGGFAAYLEQQGIEKGDRILLWGENRPEWVVAFWGSVVRGVQVVPIDFRSSAQFLKRIQQEVHAKLLVHGDSLSPESGTLECLPFDSLGGIEPRDRVPVVDVVPDDVVEIVYTSGTTGEPKGVVHRHRNLCANLNPFRHEINKYKSYARPFQPIRFLNLLPLSHMFGQAAGLFVPMLLGGSVVFMAELHSKAIIECIRRERVSVLVSVPRVVENLKGEIHRTFGRLPEPAQLRGVVGVAWRWWRYRRIHAAFGWKFWALVVGGARVDPELEAFWSRLGFVSLQGYGLTETSPVVTVNHPFRVRRGSIGKPMSGQEVRINPDGEILVRGENVATEYLAGGIGSPILHEDGWFHTGDLGSVDEDGCLYYKGRKKDLIVTSDGLNVHPDDVESVLNRLPGIRESTVVASAHSGEERVHAVLILESEQVDPEGLVGQANEQLEPHQRIRGWSLWGEEDFPRTPATSKIKRGEVATRVVEAGGPTPASQPSQGKERAGILEQLLSSMSGREPGLIRGELRLAEDLGISSLDRVDLLARLEDGLGVELGEVEFAQISTVGELNSWLTEMKGETVSESFPPSWAPASTRSEARAERRLQGDERLPKLPRWSRWLPLRWLRWAVQEGFALPVFRHYIPVSVSGVQNLSSTQPPLIFAANHASHLDTVALLAGLPYFWRRRLAPAMAQEAFRPFFRPAGYTVRQRASAVAQYVLACACFNAYPLPRETAGVRQVLRYTGDLLDSGFCPLVYPEGHRSPDGKLQEFKGGIGFMALHLRVPIVPVYLGGTFDVYSVHHQRPRRGSVRVSFGSPIRFSPGLGYDGVAREVEAAIRSLKQEAVAGPTGD